MLDKLVIAIFLILLSISQIGLYKAQSKAQALTQLCWEEHAALNDETAYCLDIYGISYELQERLTEDEILDLLYNH